jgi:O-acetylserine/cysteine efflux transporter
LAYTVGVGFFTIAVQHAQLSTVSFVSSLPLLGLFAWLFYRERIKVATIPVILVSVVGLALLTGVDLRDFQLGWGETAAIIAMLGFDLGYILVRQQSKRFSNDQHTTIMLLVSWIPVFAVSMWQGEALVPAHVSPAGWIGLVMASAFNIAGIFGLNYVFGHLKAYVVGNLLLLEGVFAVVIGFLFYGEVPGPRVLLGAVVILGCAYMISFIDARANRLEAAQTAEMA